MTNASVDKMVMIMIMIMIIINNNKKTYLKRSSIILLALI